MRLERGLPLCMGGGTMVSGGSAKAAISIRYPQTSALEYTFRQASVIVVDGDIESL